MTSPTAPSPAALGTRLREALDGPYVSARAEARALFPAAGMHRDPGLGVEESRTWVMTRLGELAACGLGAAGVPTGADATADPLAAVTTFEMLAHGDMSVTIKSGVQFGLFGGAVTNLGTAWHHRTFLPGITDLSLLGCFAMTELGHGSDVSALETTITYLPQSDEYEVHSPTPGATKAYIGNAARDGRMAAVFGQLEVDGTRHGVHVILVPLRDDDGRDLPGITTGDHGHKGGLVGVDNGTIRFDHVRVPRRMLLDRYGGVGEDGRYVSPIENPHRRFFTMLGTLVRGRVCIAAASGIGARRALSIAALYGLRRRQFVSPTSMEGVVLMDYAVHQRRLLPRIARAYALGFAQNALTARLVAVQGGGGASERDQRELEQGAAGLKAMASWWAIDAIQESREACGGAGYMSENLLTELRRDVDVFATFEGDNTVLLQLVAKGLLNDYRDAWRALDRVGVVQATTRAVGDTMVERSGAALVVDRLVQATRRRTEEAAIEDRGWQALMFEERERHSLDSLARRMRAAARDEDAFTALSRLGDHVQFVARAHVERTVLDEFIAAIEETEDAEVRAVLGRLCDLYALHSIHESRAWYLEHHFMTTARSKVIGAHLTAVCARLRPDTEALVEGMGIPRAWLGAPLLDDERLAGS